LSGHRAARALPLARPDDLVRCVPGRGPDLALVHAVHRGALDHGAIVVGALPERARFIVHVHHGDQERVRTGLRRAVQLVGSNP
jgi:hypothetical protein